MHGAFGIYLIISIEILAITAVLHFLLKATKEGVGGLIKWIGYIILIAGFLIMLCSLTQGIIKMANHKDAKTEDCRGCGDMRGHMMMRGHCCGDDDGCDMKDGKNCPMDSGKCQGMKDGKGMMHMNMMGKDSAGSK